MRLSYRSCRSSSKRLLVSLGRPSNRSAYKPDCCTESLFEYQLATSLKFRAKRLIGLMPQASSFRSNALHDMMQR